MLSVVLARRTLAARLASVAALAFAVCGGMLSRDARGQRSATGPALRPLFSRGAHPVHVGRPAARTGRGNAEDCADCHREIAREWARSLHKSAWTDEVFQAAYDVEPMTFCRNCHAPLAREGTRPTGVAAREGVSCSVCHVRDGQILSSGAGRGDAPGTIAPHAVRADARFAQSEHCAGCHQFNFPAETTAGGPLFDTRAPMQDTFGEWQRSSHAARGTQCQDCHMPWRTAPDGARYRSHDFAGARDPSLLARSVRIEARATREGAALVVRARVIPTDVGHAFPTGDLFRRLELSVWIDGEPRRAQIVSFARSFSDVYERTPGGHMAFVRRQSGDSRVQPPGTGTPRENELRFTGASATHALIVRWKLEHLLMPSPQAAAQGFGAARNRATVIEGSTSVTAGITP
jgi:hypothetical protein